MKRSLFVEVLLAIAAVALVSVGLAGLLTRYELDNAFAAYLATLPQPGGGMGMGRHMALGGAEQTFLATLDRGILVGSLISFALAVVAALVFAYYLTRPIDRLTTASKALADGDLEHRVDVGGPVEVRRLGESFNAMADSLEQGERLRRRMVADVAHELRNPIAALQGQLEGVADGVLVADPARLESLNMDVRYLARLVGDLQDLSAADAGKLSYDMTSLDLATLACAQVERARERADRPLVDIQCDVAGACAVDGDEQRLTQVIRNLIDNALRHTERGSVVIAVRPEDDRVSLEVIDTGEGIPVADLPFVFERFYRADGVRSRDTGGSGIGLSIAKRIVEDHGGSVFAENGTEDGAVVGFSLPRTASEPHAANLKGAARTDRSDPDQPDRDNRSS